MLLLQYRLLMGLGTRKCRSIGGKQPVLLGEFQEFFAGEKSTHFLQLQRREIHGSIGHLTQGILELTKFEGNLICHVT